MRMRRIISFTAALCMLCGVLCSCEKEKDNEETVTELSTVESVTVTAVETVAEIEAMMETGTTAEKTEAVNESYLSEYYVEGDYYVEVTDKNGDSRLVYYRPAVEENEAYIYMHAANSHPEASYGLVSVLPTYITAADKEFDYRDMLVCLDEGAEKFSAAFMKEDGKEWGGILYDDTESYRWLMDYFKGFEPEYIDIVTTHFDGTPMKKEELEERGFVFGYSGRLTPTSMYCSANGSFLYSVVDISLAEYNGRYAAKINLDSFHDTAKLLESGEVPTPEQLEKAYYTSFSSESQWFYVEDEFIVELMERILLSHTADLGNVSKGKNYEEAEENAYLPENITKHFEGGSTDGWEYKGDLQGITYALPEKPALASDEQVIWTSDEGFTVKITDSWITGMSEYTLDKETDRYVKYIFEEGTSIHGKLSYASYYDNVQKAYYDVVGMYAPGGQGYDVECYFKSEERTAEYDKFVKSFLGSFDVNTAQKAEMADAEKLHAPMVLSGTPSRFTDEGYHLADSYTPMGSDVYKAYTPGIIWADFYVVDYDKSYESGFEAILEKKGEDGSWYEVLPIGEIAQANNGTGHFYHAFEEGRDSVLLDLACYPLLPEGDYRIVKPFWEKDNPDKQYGAFYEFKVSEDCYKGEPVEVNVKTAKDSYPSDVSEIEFMVSRNGLFSMSSVADIERRVDGVWKSVRSGRVETNSIGGSYSIGMLDPLPTKDFDLSVPGEYRIRVSVGEVTDDMELFTYNYNTAYGYFTVE